MNIFSKLPLIGDKDPQLVDDLELIDDVEAEAEAKRRRIKFHRESVRNGPVKFKTVTNGQVRRMKARALKSHSRKVYRQQVRQYLANQREAAILRGQLQAAGVVSYAIPSRKLTPKAAHDAIVWIIERYASSDESGVVEVTQEVVVDALLAALNRFETLTGLPSSRALSPAYVLPVSVAA